MVFFPGTGKFLDDALGTCVMKAGQLLKGGSYSDQAMTSCTYDNIESSMFRERLLGCYN